MLAKEDPDIGHAWDFDAATPEDRLQRELHGLLATPDDQVPGFRLLVMLGLRQDSSSLAEVALGHLEIRQSSITSPGFQSGFKIQ